MFDRQAETALHIPDLCFLSETSEVMAPENDDQKPSLITRRGILRLLALTGAGLAAGSGTSQAFVDFFSSSYADFLGRMRLRQMSIRQVIAPHAKSHGSVHNTLPPRYLWRNIGSTLKVVDQLADRLDLPLKEIVSVYRTPAYNARCPGAKSNSYHVRNNAMDIVFSCPPGKVAAMARAMRATGLFKGGVGRYGSFTHIDTRGANADW
jgi:hypothetical protein